MSHVRLTLVVVYCLSTALFSSVSWAESPNGHRLSSFQFYTENDTYLRSGTTDEYYTNGIRAAWMLNSSPPWTENLIAKWCKGRAWLCPDVPADISYGHALGQNMYTPDSIVDPNPQPDDRPWAGYLYYSWLVSATFPSRNKRDVAEPVQNLFELQVGLVGPGAGAKWAQTFVHQNICHPPCPKPLGWSNQLKNEPAANLIYLWRKKIGSTNFDVVPHWGAALGNVQTYANAGATVRLGYGISSFPQNIIAPSNSDSSRPGPIEAFVFVGGEGRAVARNMFLDGNTFRSGPESHIERDWFVTDLKSGLVLRYKALQIGYTYVRRSREFDPPSGHPDGSHRFGSIALSYNMWRP